MGETHCSSTPRVFNLTVDCADYPRDFTPEMILEELFGELEFEIDNIVEI